MIIAAKVPMMFRDFYRGSQYRVAYRGPRNTVLDINRTKVTRQASCLEANAVYFTVYARKTPYKSRA